MKNVDIIAYNKLRLTWISVASGVMISILTLAYSFRWVTLGAFHSGSAGTDYGYPFGFVGRMVVGPMPAYTLSVAHNYYFDPLALLMDLVVWISVAAIVSVSVATLKFDRGNRRSVYYSLLLTASVMLLSLTLNFGSSNLPTRGAPLPYLEYTSSLNGWSLIIDPPFIYSGVIIPSFIFDVCFLYIVFLGILSAYFGRKTLTLSGN